MRGRDAAAGTGRAAAAEAGLGLTTPPGRGGVRVCAGSRRVRSDPAAEAHHTRTAGNGPRPRTVLAIDRTPEPGRPTHARTP